MAQLSVGEVCEVALLEVLEGGDFKVALAAASDGNWEHSVGSHWGRPLAWYSDRAVQEPLAALSTSRWSRPVGHADVQQGFVSFCFHFLRGWAQELWNEPDAEGP